MKYIGSSKQKPTNTSIFFSLFTWISHQALLSPSLHMLCHLSETLFPFFFFRLLLVLHDSAQRSIVKGTDFLLEMSTQISPPVGKTAFVSYLFCICFCVIHTAVDMNPLYCWLDTQKKTVAWTH